MKAMGLGQMFSTVYSNPKDKCRGLYLSVLLLKCLFFNASMSLSVSLPSSRHLQLSGYKFMMGIQRLTHTNTDTPETLRSKRREVR